MEKNYQDHVGKAGARMNKRVQTAALAVTMSLTWSTLAIPMTQVLATSEDTFLENGYNTVQPQGFINLDKTVFPDPAFLEYVAVFDLNQDGKLYQSELDQVNEINAEGLEIQDMTGIEHFSSLSMLKCGKNQIGSLDLSANKKLRFLYCQENKLTELNVSANTGLTILYCGNNLLSALDVSHNTALQYLSCQHNKIKALDLSMAHDLKDLQCFDNALTSLNVSRSSDLGNLRCYANKITDLQIGSSTKLAKLVKSSKRLEKKVDGLDIFCYEKETAHLYYDKKTEPKLSGTSFSDFIERLYVVALNRTSDESGKTFWMKRVRDDGYTGADCARYFLIEAGEFANRGLSEEEFIDVLYRTFFNRESDAAGKAFWMGELDKGASRNTIVNGFIESTEWCNLCAVYGVRSGAEVFKATVPSQSAVRFASRIYDDCLQREAEEGGLLFWSLQLTNYEASGSGTMKYFFTSEEFTSKDLSDEEFIERVYRAYMGRESDLTGLVYWVSLLEKGTPREDVLDQFAGSKEFEDICKNYGIARY